MNKTIFYRIECRADIPPSEAIGLCAASVGSQNSSIYFVTHGVRVTRVNDEKETTFIVDKLDLDLRAGKVAVTEQDPL